MGMKLTEVMEDERRLSTRNGRLEAAVKINTRIEQKMRILFLLLGGFNNMLT